MTAFVLMSMFVGLAIAQPQTSLLQFKASSKKSQSLTAEGTSSALAGFQKFADKMVADYLKTGAPMTEDAKKAVETIIKYIDEMHKRLKLEHDEDKKEIGACKSNLDSCEASYLPDDKKVLVSGLEKDTNEKREVHKECRKQFVEKCTPPYEDCSKYDIYRRSSAAVPPPCIAAGHLANEMIKTDDDFERQDMELCLKSTKTWLDGLYKAYQSCQRITDQCENVLPKECDKDQTDFEVAYCDEDLDRDGLCNSHKTCWDDGSANCESICDRINILVEARKADSETGGRIKCLLGVLKDETDEKKPAALETCKTTAYDTSDFILTCPDENYPYEYEAPEMCEEGVLSRPEPCEGSFKRDEYSGMEVGTCKECSLVEWKLRRSRRSLKPETAVAQEAH